MNYLVLVLLILFPFSGFGQEKPSGKPVGQGPVKIGIISGNVLDDQSGQPVPFVSVAAYRLPDSTVTGGVLSDEKGKFRITELPPGKYTLRFSSVGYKTWFLPPVIIKPDEPSIQTGPIRLAPGATRLKEVNITSEAPELINTIDKKVYSVEKNIVNTGGTVTEVLNNIPSVTVDIDGKVALRGSENVTILIDGKPSGMLGNDRRAVLQQIPASAVDQIEVITNPSAKYDAEGMAGIINIKTKRDKFKGTNGNASVGVGSNNKYNLNLNGNDRSPIRNIYANYTFRHEDRFHNGEGTQYNYLPGIQDYSWFSESNGESSSNVHTGRFGIDYYLSPQNTLGANVGITSRSEDDPQNFNYFFYDSAGNLNSSFFRQDQTTESNGNFDANLDYKHVWKHNKAEFTATAGYSRNERDDYSQFKNSLSGFNGPPYQVSDNTGLFQNLVAQADIAWPVKNSGKIEGGLKSTLRQVDNDQVVSNLEESTGDYIADVRFSDQFVYDEQVIAAYSMYSGSFKKFDYNVGVRAEQTLVDIQSKQSGQSTSNDYINLFPSVFLKYNIPSSQEVQFSYSRRINRPDSRQLNPYTDFSDSLSIRYGNPYLNPELIHSLELAYAWNWKSNSITSSVYYRHTDDLISRYRSVDTLTGISTMTQVNFSSSDNIGWETILRLQAGKWGTVMTSFNIYSNRINADNINPELQSEATQWNARVNFNGKITPTTSLQVTVNYLSPMVSPVSEVKGMSGVDAGIRQEIWKGKGSVNFNVTDIFFTRKFQIHNFSEYHDYNGIRIRESRVAMLTLSYRFGKAEMGQRRKNRQDQRGSEQQDMIDF